MSRKGFTDEDMATPEPPAILIQRLETVAEVHYDYNADESVLDVAWKECGKYLTEQISSGKNRGKTIEVQFELDSVIHRAAVDIPRTL